MEELIKATEAVLRLEEELVDAVEKMQRQMKMASRADMPDAFYYMSLPGDFYLITAHNGQIIEVESVAAINIKDTAIRDYYAMAQDAE